MASILPPSEFPLQISVPCLLSSALWYLKSIITLCPYVLCSMRLFPATRNPQRALNLDKGRGMLKFEKIQRPQGHLALKCLYLTTCCQIIEVSCVGCQGKKMIDTETWHPTPETYIYYRRAYSPAGATFPERSLGKILGPCMPIVWINVLNNFDCILNICKMGSVQGCGEVSEPN